MRWFKNLNATPRLMLSFGVLVALIAGISYFGIDSLAKANDRTGILYHEYLQGAVQADNIAKARLAIGKAGRDALIHIDDAATVEADEKTIVSDLAAIHTNLDAAAATFYSPESLEALTTMKSAMPAYEQGWAAVLRQLQAKDGAAAKAGIDALNQTGKPLEAASEQAVHVKEVRAGEKFQAGVAAYQAVRFALVAATLASMGFAFLLSIAIARSFAAPLGLAVGVLGQVAAGDLTASLDVDSQDEVGRMAASLNAAVEKLRSTLLEVADGAANTSSVSQELAAAARAIATGAQEQAASIEETSASLEQITATVRQSADNAKQANQLAFSSRESAEGGQQVVAGAVAAMQEINVASAKISEIISTIDEIAFQTNLLAVNAAIEAARAGEDGRGFAVVATEVRSLAARSAAAAKEIKALIQDSLRKVERGSDLVSKSGETLKGIVGAVKRVTDVVGEIAAAAAEQSAGIGQVGTAVTQMDHVTQSNAAQTEELSSTAQAMSDQAARLSGLVAAFQLGAPARDSYAAPRADSETRRPVASAKEFALAKRSSKGTVVSVSAGNRTGSSPTPPTRREASTALAAASDDSFEEF